MTRLPKMTKNFLLLWISDRSSMAPISVFKGFTCGANVLGFTALACDAVDHKSTVTMQIRFNFVCPSVFGAGDSIACKVKKISTSCAEVVSTSNSWNRKLLLKSACLKLTRQLTRSASLRSDQLVQDQVIATFKHIT